MAIDVTKITVMRQRKGLAMVLDVCLSLRPLYSVSCVGAMT